MINQSYSLYQKISLPRLPASPPYFAKKVQFVEQNVQNSFDPAAREFFFRQGPSQKTCPSPVQHSFEQLYKIQHVG